MPKYKAKKLKLNDLNLTGCYIKQIMNVFYSCSGKNIFIR